MKRRILLFCAAALSFSFVLAQESSDEAYFTDMNKVLSKMEGLSDTAVMVKIAKKFEKVGNKHPGHWIPYYNAAQALTVVSLYEDKSPQKDAHLLKAQEMVDSAFNNRPDGSEIHVMQAMVLASQVMVDPKIRAMVHYSQLNSSLKKAREANPENPRIYLVSGFTKAVLPEFLGGGPEEAKAQYLVAEEKFETFSNPDPFWPGWGEPMLQKELDKLEDVQVEE